MPTLPTPSLSREPSALRRIFLLQIALVVGATALVVVAASLESNPGGGVGFFWFAFLAGCFGSTIGMVRQTRSDKKALRELSRSWTALLVPHLYGGLLAGLTYFLFVSGILSGTGKSGLLTSNLFPDFTNADAAGSASVRAYLALRPASLADAGKLMVWCFMAGYSEGFVVGILDHLRSVERGPGQPGTGEGAKGSDATGGNEKAGADGEAGVERDPGEADR